MIIHITYIFVFLITAAYLALIVYFARGWKKIPFTDSRIIKENLPTVSVIIALHNEEKNAASLINSLKKQSFNNFELVMVDDFSTDKTLKILEENIAGFSNAKIIALPSHKGKKRAISEGITHSEGELIITTDADCTHAEHWIESIVAFYLETKADLISAPVRMKGNDTLFDGLQETEFMSLNASGAGAVGAGKPIMCNAANMAFTREAWQKSQTKLKFETASGDDVFLLLYIKKQGGKICFLKNPDAIVTTGTKQNMNSFFQQRVRWSGKAKYYSDKHIIFTSVMIFGINLCQILLLFLSFINPGFAFIFMVLFLLKFVADFLFLKSVNGFYRIEKLFSKSLLLSVVYPYYILLTAVFSFFTPKNRW